jgi:uncharacterized protein YhdP
MTPAERSALSAVESRAAAWRRRGALAGALLALLAVAVLTYPLAALRAPEQRARLEQLLRYETGLEVRFSRLTVRFGWVGPEAVLHDVQLGAPGDARPTLRAPRLIASLDLWRLTRAGELSAGRITLEDPTIDLAPAAAAPVPAAARGSGAPPAALRLLSGWRGGRIDIAGGTLRMPLAMQAPLDVGIRRAQLRHVGAHWSADAQLLLPPALGEDAHLALRLNGEPAASSGLSGTLTFSGQQLELAGWRALAPGLSLARYLPEAGQADLSVRAQLHGNRLSQLEGRVQGSAVSWRTGSADALTLPQAGADWQLLRAGSAWRLSARLRGLGAGRESTLTLTTARDGSAVQGVVQHAPLPILAALSRLSAPELPLQTLGLDGEARWLRFDWDGTRVPGSRLRTDAELDDVSIALGAARLRGLTARLCGSPGDLTAQLTADDAALDFPGTGGEGLGQLHLSSPLRFVRTNLNWSLSSEALRLQRGELRLTARAALAAAAQHPPLLHAQLAIEEVDVALLTRLLGPGLLQRLKTQLPRPESGRLEKLALRWDGPLAPLTAGSVEPQFSGAARVRGLVLAAAGDWPRLENIAAQLSWQGARGQATITAADSGSFHLQDGSAAWDLHGPQRLRFAAHLSGDAREGLAWLRAHPQIGGRLSAAGAIDLRGATRSDLLVSVPRSGVPHVRLATLLDGAQLYPVAGLPPIAALRGTLTVHDGQLQRSQLSGQWLGGAVTLLAAEWPGAQGPLPILIGHGTAAAREVLEAAHADAAVAQLTGATEWRAQLVLLPERWQLRADSSLAGLASTLPEPFGKPAAAALPLHIALDGADDAALLQVALGERLHAVARLERSSDTWRIERGALRLAQGVPALPTQAQLLLDGRIAHLDLPACLALWRAASTDPALPPLSARMSAATLSVGSHHYDEVLLSARADATGSTLNLSSAGLSGDARWPAIISVTQPATVHLQRVTLATPADALLAAGLAAALAPSSELSVDELMLDGRPLGRLNARLAAQDGALRLDELSLKGTSDESSASGLCQAGECQLRFWLDSHDGAATLAAFGLKPEASAAHAQMSGELRFAWPAQAPLATLGGHLHMRMEDGTAIASQGPGPRFALLSVPGLLAGLGPTADALGSQLHFDRLVADYQLADGEATTTGLHFDGDAEILVRGRIDLTHQDYDQQAWILRGEARLPAPVRRLSPTPRVAAAWLALRELFGANASDPRGNALRLRGAWNDPIVSPAE